MSRGERWAGTGALVVLAVLVLTAEARAQRMTERYIPVGQSPGLSGRVTTIGEIQDADAESRTVTVAANGESVTVRITDETYVWLDRSEEGLTNLDGDFSDLRPGRRAEIHYRDPDARESAVWIKVVVPPGG